MGSCFGHIGHVVVVEFESLAFSEEVKQLVEYVGSINACVVDLVPDRFCQHSLAS